MRVFIKKVILFFSPIVILAIAYEITVRNIENDYSYKNKWLTSNSNEVELLAIGSSHCYLGINPDYLSLSSFNAGHSSQSIQYDYLIFDKFYEHFDSLKLLIITVSYPDPFYIMEDWPECETLIRNYAIYYHIPTFSLKYKLEIFNGINWRLISDYLYRSASNRQCNDCGFLFDPPSNAVDWHKITTKAKSQSFDSFNGPLHKKLEASYKANFVYMEQMINLCRAKNAQVILLTTPVHELYRRDINEEEWAMTKDFCRNLTEEFDNVSYINMFDDPRFEDDDFYDADHLNPKGAAKLTTILNEYIQSNPTP